MKLLHLISSLNCYETRLPKPRSFTKVTFIYRWGNTHIMHFISPSYYVFNQKLTTRQRPLWSITEKSTMKLFILGTNLSQARNVISDPVPCSSTFTPRCETRFEIRSAISQVGGSWNLMVTCKMTSIQPKLNLKNETRGKGRISTRIVEIKVNT